MAHLLVTGGAGFIGSHTCLVLLEAGHDLVILDNFSNSSPIALERVQQLAKQPLEVIQGDVRDAIILEKLFKKARYANKEIDAVIHFAGLKAVGESVSEPLRYWDVNVNGTRNLLSVMDSQNCRTLVFSSTSTVYGEPNTFPITEMMETKPIHPYAQTKLAVEQMLNALTKNGKWRSTSLRYFNPVGAHPSGLIGENPLGIPNNLFPYITQVAAGKLKKLKIFGNDYPTQDGTGIRDYIHVMDLAEAHAAAVDHILKSDFSLNLTLNLGTGKGLSVLEVVQAFEVATGISIPYEVVSRRSGDVVKLEACSKEAERILHWKTQRSLLDMCRDGWAWQASNPNGFEMKQ